MLMEATFGLAARGAWRYNGGSTGARTLLGCSPFLDNGAARRAKRAIAKDIQAVGFRLAGPMLEPLLGRVEDGANPRGKLGECKRFSDHLNASLQAGVVNDGVTRVAGGE